MKKFIIALALLAFLSSPAYAVTRYWVGGGSSGNWSATGNTNWGSASGTRDNQAVPTAAEDVVFDAHANGNTPCTVTATAACKSLIFTGAGGDWANTFKINDTIGLTVSGLVTLKNTFTWTQSTGILLMGTAATLTNNSCLINCDFGVGNVTVTVADTMHVNGDLRSVTGDSAVLSAAGATALTCSKGLNCSRKLTCTNVTITCDGSGIWTGSSTNGRYLDAPVIINTGGTIIMSTPSVGGDTYTYTAGTIDNGTTTMYIQGNTTFSGAWPTWYNMSNTTASTVTIDNPMNIYGSLTLGANLTFAGDYPCTLGTLTSSATAIMTFQNSWLINIINVYEAGIFTLAGQYPQICNDLIVRSGAFFSLPDDQQLTIMNSIISNGTSFDTTTIKSTTVNKESKIAYLGTPQNQMIARTIFAGICACNGYTLYNYMGGVANPSTGTVKSKNIINFTFPVAISENMFGFPKPAFGE